MKKLWIGLLIVGTLIIGSCSDLFDPIPSSNSSLERISVSSGADMDKPFDPDTLDYTVKVKKENRGKPIVISLDSFSPGAVVALGELKNTNRESDVKVAWNPNDKTITLTNVGQQQDIDIPITVISETGTETAYNIKVNVPSPAEDDNSLSRLRVWQGDKEIALSPTFNAETLKFTALLDRKYLDEDLCVEFQTTRPTAWVKKFIRGDLVFGYDGKKEDPQHLIFDINDGEYSRISYGLVDWKYKRADKKDPSKVNIRTINFRNYKDVEQIQIPLDIVATEADQGQNTKTHYTVILKLPPLSNDAELKGATAKQGSTTKQVTVQKTNPTSANGGISGEMTLDFSGKNNFVDPIAVTMDVDAGTTLEVENIEPEGAARYEIDNQTKTIKLTNYGGDTKVTLTVKAENGSVTKKYKVTVNLPMAAENDSSLRDIVVKQGSGAEDVISVDPAFVANTFNYDLKTRTTAVDYAKAITIALKGVSKDMTISDSATDITVTPSSVNTAYESSTKTITIQNYQSATQDIVVKVTPTAKNGSTKNKTYTFTIPALSGNTTISLDDFKDKIKQGTKTLTVKNVTAGGTTPTFEVKRTKDGGDTVITIPVPENASVEDITPQIPNEPAPPSTKPLGSDSYEWVRDGNKLTLKFKGDVRYNDVTVPIKVIAQNGATQITNLVVKAADFSEDNSISKFEAKMGNGAKEEITQNPTNTYMVEPDASSPKPIVLTLDIPENAHLDAVQIAKGHGVEPEDVIVDGNTITIKNYIYSEPKTELKIPVVAEKATKVKEYTVVLNVPKPPNTDASLKGIVAKQENTDVTVSQDNNTFKLTANKKFYDKPLTIKIEPTSPDATVATPVNSIEVTGTNFTNQGDKVWNGGTKTLTLTNYKKTEKITFKFKVTAQDTATQSDEYTVEIIVPALSSSTEITGISFQQGGGAEGDAELKSTSGTTGATPTFEMKVHSTGTSTNQPIMLTTTLPEGARIANGTTLVLKSEDGTTKTLEEGTDYLISGNQIKILNYGHNTPGRDTLTATIKVTAEDGGTTEAAKVNIIVPSVSADPRFSAFYVNQGGTEKDGNVTGGRNHHLIPEFNPDTLNYTIYVNNTHATEADQMFYLWGSLKDAHTTLRVNAFTVDPTSAKVASLASTAGLNGRLMEVKDLDTIKSVAVPIVAEAENGTDKIYTFTFMFKDSAYFDGFTTLNADNLFAHQGDEKIEHTLTGTKFTVTPKKGTGYLKPLVFSLPISNNAHTSQTESASLSRVDVTVGGKKVPVVRKVGSDFINTADGSDYQPSPNEPYAIRSAVDGTLTVNNYKDGDNVQVDFTVVGPDKLTGKDYTIVAQVPEKSATTELKAAPTIKQGGESVTNVMKPTATATGGLTLAKSVGPIEIDFSGQIPEGATLFKAENDANKTTWELADGKGTVHWDPVTQKLTVTDYGAGPLSIPFTVTAEDGTVKTYTFNTTVPAPESDNTELKTPVVQQGSGTTLSVTQSNGTYEVTVDKTKKDDDLVLTLTPFDSKARVSVDTTSGIAVEANSLSSKVWTASASAGETGTLTLKGYGTVQEITVTATVTAENTTTKDYTIKITVPKQSSDADTALTKVTVGSEKISMTKFTKNAQTNTFTYELDKDADGNYKGDIVFTLTPPAGATIADPTSGTSKVTLTNGTEDQLTSSSTGGVTATWNGAGTTPTLTISGYKKGGKLKAIFTTTAEDSSTKKLTVELDIPKASTKTVIDKITGGQGSVAFIERTVVDAQSNYAIDVDGTFEGKEAITLNLTPLNNATISQPEVKKGSTNVISTWSNSTLTIDKGNYSSNSTLTVTFKVTAEDTETTKDYTITLNISKSKDTSLKTLVASQNATSNTLTLSPAFSETANDTRFTMKTLSQYVDTENSNNTIIIKIQPNAKATITGISATTGGDSATTATFTVERKQTVDRNSATRRTETVHRKDINLEVKLNTPSLTPGGERTITVKNFANAETVNLNVVVQAEDGTTTQTYTLIIKPLVNSVAPNGSSSASVSGSQHAYTAGSYTYLYDAFTPNRTNKDYQPNIYGTTYGIDIRKGADLVTYENEGWNFKVRRKKGSEKVDGWYAPSFKNDFLKGAMWYKGEVEVWAENNDFVNNFGEDNGWTDFAKKDLGELYYAMDVKVVTVGGQEYVELIHLVKNGGSEDIEDVSIAGSSNPKLNNTTDSGQLTQTKVGLEIVGGNKKLTMITHGGEGVDPVDFMRIAETTKGQNVFDNNYDTYFTGTTPQENKDVVLSYGWNIGTLRAGEIAKRVIRLQVGDNN